MRHTVSAILLIFLLLFQSLPVIAEGAEDDTAFSTDREDPADLILSAMELYSWFTISPLDVDPELTSPDGSLARVADDTLCNADTVMRLLDFTFSPQIVTELMDYETYETIDGLLYSAGGGRAMDASISEVEYTETLSTDERIEYTVTVHYLGEGENGVVPDEFLFVREPVNGLWVFTSFPFFW